MNQSAGAAAWTGDSHGRPAADRGGDGGLVEQRLARGRVLDGVLVGDAPRVAPPALGEQVAQALVVHLDEGRVQVVLPPLPAQLLRRVQDLRAAARRGLYTTANTVAW